MPYPTTPVPGWQLLAGFANAALDDSTGWTVDAPGVTPAAGHWTDISGYAERYAVKRGRQPQTGLVEAGTLNVQLRSDGGEFATWGSSGRFTPYLQALRQVQARVTVGGVVYKRFTGLVSRWGQRWGLVLNEADLEAADLFRYLNGVNLGTGAYEAAVRAVAAHWWRLNDPAGSTQGADSILGAGATPLYASNTAGSPPASPPTFGGGPLLNASPGAGSVDLGQWVSTNQTNPPVQPYLSTYGGPGGTEWTVGAWFSGLKPGQYQVLFGQWGSTTFPAYYVKVANGVATLVVLSSASSAVGIPSTVYVADGTPHHVVVVVSGGQWYLFVDGLVAATTTTLAGAINSTANLLTFGGALYGAYNASGQQILPVMAGGMVVGEAFVAAALSGSQVVNLFSLGIGYPQQRVDDRVTGVLNTVGVPAAWRDFNVAAQVCQPNAVDLTKVTALVHIQQAAQTEEGICYMSRDGKVTFRSRQTVATAAPYAVTQATFGDRFQRAGQIVDSVARADNAVSPGSTEATGGADVHPWQVRTAGPIGVAGNRFYKPTNDLVHDQMTVPLGCRDHSVEAVLGGSGYQALLARYAGPNDHILVQCQLPGTITVNFVTPAGGFVTMGTAGSAVGGDTLRVICDGGDVFVYKNGVVAAGFSDSAHFGANVGIDLANTSARMNGFVAGGFTDVPYRPDVDIGVDDQDIAGRAEVTRTGGTLQAVNSAAAGRTVTRPGMLHLTDAASAQHAAWLVNRSATATTRVRSLKVDLTDFLDQPALLAQVLNLDLLHRVAVNRSEVGFFQTGNIDGYEEVASASEWQMTFHMSIADAYATWSWAGAQ